VPYPTGANGDATVVLELVISPDGAVTEATVVEGDEPFATQARTSVLQWRFTPAQRGATPIAARIRARVDFHQDLPVAPTSAPAPSAAAAPQPSAAEKLAVLEVTIRGERNENGQTTFSIEEVRALPGAFGDPFRAIDALPGVIPVVSGFPYFFIRGAPPNDNAYYVDGIRVPLLFHIGLGQGVIHPSLVDRVDFIPGAPPASYSGSAGAIIAGQTRDPSPELRIAANLRLVDAGALLEVPFADGRGSALIAGRYGYPGPIVGAFANDVSLGYWDYQTRASWLFADRDSLRLFAFGSHDYLATGTPLTEQFVSDFHRVSLRYEHALSDGYVRAEGLFGYDRRGADPSYLTGTSTALRLELDQALSPAVRIRAGVAASFDDSCGAIQRRSRTLRQASAR
jgi:TonB family protein